MIYDPLLVKQSWFFCVMIRTKSTLIPYCCLINIPLHTQQDELMKSIVFFFFLATCLYSQNHTEVKFNYVKDVEQRLANQLNNINMLTIVCEDTTMRGKTFKLITTEYKNGELVKTDNYGMTCEDQVDEFEINGEKYQHVLNLCNSIRFKEKEDKFEIVLAIKQVGDSSKMIIHYPYLELQPTYSSTPKFDLRVALAKTGKKYIVPIGEKIPILTYNPPYEIEGGEMLWSCILDTEDPGKWYKDYQIDHFYIISLLIE